MKVRLKLAKRHFLNESVNTGIIDPRDKEYIKKYATDFAKGEERYLKSIGQTLEMHGAASLADVCRQQWVEDTGPATDRHIILPSGKKYDNHAAVSAIQDMFEIYIQEYIDTRKRIQKHKENRWR